MSRLTAPLVLAAVALLAGVLSAGAAPGVTTRVSVSSSGAEADDDSLFPAISADGRFVAFESAASNLVPGDEPSFCPNAIGVCTEVFVHDRQTGATESVSGNTLTRSSRAPSISGDGRYVAFISEAPLLPYDTNDFADVYVRDRQLNSLELSSIGMGGVPSNSGSFSVEISDDGRFVAFEAEASNLVPGDANGLADIFTRDRQTGSTERISVDSGGLEANGRSARPVVSSDGRLVAFYSDASNLVAGDTNDAGDVFVRDRQAGTTERVSLATGGGEADAFPQVDISGDGRFVAFNSSAPSLVPAQPTAPQLFVRDRQTGVTEQISLGAEGTPSFVSGGSLSADGRYVAFWSDSSNIVSADTNFAGDVFVRDRQAGTTERISLSLTGSESTGGYDTSEDISGDGSLVVFSSFASDLVTCDTNQAIDIFVNERQATAPSGTPAPCPTPTPEPTPTPSPQQQEVARALPETGGEAQGGASSTALVLGAVFVTVAAAVWAGSRLVRR